MYKSVITMNVEHNEWTQQEDMISFENGPYNEFVARILARPIMIKLSFGLHMLELCPFI
jgi:hypothetical protein